MDSQGQGRIHEDGAMRWILGYDGACASCSVLARQIEELSAGRITVRSLRDPEVQAWRREALGIDAPWMPTLFSIKDEKVRAWLRAGLAWRLARLLGPTKSWQVVRALDNGTRTSAAPPHPERRAFVRALGGIAVASRMAGIVPGATSAPVSSPRYAMPWNHVAFLSHREVTGEEKATKLVQLAAHPDVRGVIGDQAANLDQAQSMLVEHRLDNGNGLLAAGWVLPDSQAILLYVLDKSVDGIRSMATRYTVDIETTTARSLAVSINGTPPKTSVAGARDSTSGMVTASASCPGCLWGGADTVYCDNFNYWGFFTSCGACVFASGVLIFVCAAIFCPAAVLANCNSGWYTICATCTF